MKGTVIIELGSTLRIGFSGEIKPRYVTSFNFFFLGSRRKMLSTFLYANLYLLFVEVLHVIPKDHDFLVIENVLTPQSFREALHYSLSADFGVRTISYQLDLPMPLVATGCQSGIVVDIGYYESRSIAIVDGKLVHTSLRITPIGVVHVYRRFCRDDKLLNNEMVEVLLKEIFERMILCKTDKGSSTGYQEHINTSNSSSVLQSMSVEKQLEITRILKSTFADELVRGSQLDGENESNDEIGGIIGVFCSTLSACSVDVHKMILGNVIICGDGATIPGIKRRLLSEFELDVDTIKSDTLKKDEVEISKTCSSRVLGLKECKLTMNYKYIPYNSAHLVWMGSSIFACLKSNEVKYTFFNYKSLSSDRKLGNLQYDSKCMPDWMSLN